MVLSLNRDERVEPAVEGDISPVHCSLYLFITKYKYNNYYN